MLLVFRALAVLVAALLSLAGPALADPATYRGEYALSYLGLPIARANFDLSADDQSYSVKGLIASAGLGAIFDDTRGNVSAAGRFSGNSIRPERFHADYVSGKKASVVDIQFSDGNVTEVTNVPPLKKRKHKDWVPLGADDLKAVIDPMAATFVRAGSLAEVCSSTVKLFDSELRADLVLSPVSTGKVSVKGYEGETVTCRLRFRPVSGYRTSKRSLEFLRTKGRMMVAYAPVGKTGIYAPVLATVGTQIGTITVRALRFEALR